MRPLAQKISQQADLDHATAGDGQPRGVLVVSVRKDLPAAKAGLQRFLTFKAWLSTPTESVADRLLHTRGRYVLVNGLAVAQNWDALTSGLLENPIMVDENSQTRDEAVWTGTLVTGQPSLGSEFCGDWDDESAVDMYGGLGLSASTDAAWSFFEPGPCFSELRLYCVEQ